MCVEFFPGIINTFKQKINELTNAKDAIAATYRRKASELGFRYDNQHRVSGLWPVRRTSVRSRRFPGDVIDETKIFGGDIKKAADHYERIKAETGWQPTHISRILSSEKGRYFENSLDDPTNFKKLLANEYTVDMFMAIQNLKELYEEYN